MDRAILRVPVQSRSHKTRAALIAAARHEFSARGYAEATAKSIAERAGVGTGTFYHYFPDKDCALVEICAERVDSLLGESARLTSVPPKDARDARAKLTAVVELYVSYHRADRGLHAVIAERRLCDPGVDAVLSAAERKAMERFATALAWWGHDGDRESAAFMMFSLLDGAVHGHVLSGPVIEETRFVQGLVEALMRIGGPRAPILRGKGGRRES